MVDLRIFDLAIKLSDNPDSVLMDGYRRLEDIIRKRSRLSEEHGLKPFRSTFHGEKPILNWPKLHKSEAIGRAEMFVNIYLGYRNKRAHKEHDTNIKESVLEFMLINHLFILESEACLEGEITEEDKQERDLEALYSDFL